MAIDSLLTSCAAFRTWPDSVELLNLNLNFFRRVLDTSYEMAEGLRCQPLSLPSD